jgi:lipoprotein-anchoring transpeptidase ErfK/SrfK
MLKRIPVIAALTGLALTGALCACGSAAQHSAAAGASASVPSSEATSAQPSSPGRSSSPAPVRSAPVPSAPVPSAPVSSAPVPGAPVIFAVRLGSGFQPSTLRISPGQHFVVTVDSSVKASGPGVPSSCPGTTARIDGGMLTVRCTSGAFYYTAQRPGTVELMATVRPRCARGSMCPQWIAEATLKITIL